ncbi:hypothetical protein HDU93_009317 [Gonapodya sp. JEL0774]|nr:hypothetical protein HDU93_009317 [Gonapodya sp. JEL0774]
MQGTHRLISILAVLLASALWKVEALDVDPKAKASLVTTSVSTAGTKVLGVLKNPLRQNSYSGFIAIQPDNKTIVFAIQGTESIPDAISDIGLLPYFGVQSHFPKAPLLSSAHSGFWNLFKAGIPSFQDAIDNILPKYPWIKRIVFTGHSLGAIQQNLNAPYFQPQLAAKGYKLETYGFAPARTVNDVFAKYLSTLPAFSDDSFYRIIQRQDIIPRILTPYFPTFYTHLGTEYYINVAKAGDTYPIYKCPAPSIGEENQYCMNTVTPLELSLFPGHTDYLGENYYGCGVLEANILEEKKNNSVQRSVCAVEAPIRFSSPPQEPTNRLYKGEWEVCTRTRSTSFSDVSMESSQKTILLFGATGRIAGAALRAMLQSTVADRYTFRAATRNPTSPKAVALKDLGVDLVKADLGDKESIEKAVVGVWGIFLVTVWAKGTLEAEQVKVAGTAVADAAHRAGVAFFVYLSDPPLAENVVLNDNKTRIEHHISSLPWPVGHTIVRPAFFFETFESSKGLTRGSLSFVVSPDVRLRWVSLADTAECIARVFGEPHKFASKTIDLVGAVASVKEMAKTLTELTGEPWTASRFPPLFLIRLVSSNLHGKIQEVEKAKGPPESDLSLLREILPSMQTFREWCQDKGVGREGAGAYVYAPTWWEWVFGRAL